MEPFSPVAEGRPRMFWTQEAPGKEKEQGGKVIRAPLCMGGDGNECKTPTSKLCLFLSSAERCDGALSGPTCQVNAETGPSKRPQKMTGKHGVMPRPLQCPPGGPPTQWQFVSSRPAGESLLAVHQRHNVLHNTVHGRAILPPFPDPGG